MSSLNDERRDSNPGCGINVQIYLVALRAIAIDLVFPLNAFGLSSSVPSVSSAYSKSSVSSVYSLNRSCKELVSQAEDKTYWFFCFTCHFPFSEKFFQIDTSLEFDEQYNYVFFDFLFCNTADWDGYRVQRHLKGRWRRQKFFVTVLTFRSDGTKIRYI